MENITLLLRVLHFDWNYIVQLNFEYITHYNKKNTFSTFFVGSPLNNDRYWLWKKNLNSSVFLSVFFTIFIHELKVRCFFYGNCNLQNKKSKDSNYSCIAYFWFNKKNCTIKMNMLISVAGQNIKNLEITRNRIRLLQTLQIMLSYNSVIF